MMRHFIWCLSLLSALVSGEEQTIKVWEQLIYHPNPAVAKLLMRALELSRPEYGPFQIIISPQMEQGRVVKELQEGNVDIGVFAPDREREQSLIGIHVPIAKGLLGWRVCLIRPDDEKRFANVRTLDQWQASGLRIGQHISWPDTAVLRANQIRVETTSVYENLFKMLVRGRFDCFLRSVIEIEDEQKQHPELAIEPSLVIRYPLALMYFVSPQKPELAKRIELGLQRARENGDFERIFQAGFGSTIKSLDLDHRVIIDIQNPDLPEISRKMLSDPALIYVQQPAKAR